MTNDIARARAEIGVCLFLIAVCAVVLWESRLIPPGTFEPLGSAPIPQAISIAIIVLCLITVIRAFRTLRLAGPAAQRDESVDTPRAHSKDALAIMVLTVTYGLVLQSKTVSFAIATMVFLFLAIGLLVRFRPRAMIVVTIVSLLMAFGSQYVFTRVFVVDLPGAF